MDKKKRIHTLSIEPDYSFYLIGISSRENDYRLSWSINNQMKTNFTRTANMQVPGGKSGIMLEFSRYNFVDDESMLHYILVSNHSENGFLLPEFSQLDFFLKITGLTKAENLNKVIHKLRKVDTILAAYELPLEKIRLRDRLIMV
jgi:hypothetical protein